jgi:hypothetical protein
VSAIRHNAATTMGELIQIVDFQASRERAQRRARDHQNIERAVALMRDNLIWAAEQLRTAPINECPELLDRIEKLTATIRYGVMMLNERGGEIAAGGDLRSLRRDS